MRVTFLSQLFDPENSIKGAKFLEKLKLTGLEISVVTTFPSYPAGKLYPEYARQHFIKNESLQTGLGELPFVESWPEVWLIQARDWDKAYQLLAGFISGETIGEWSCPICGERNPDTFELCWVCAKVPTDEANEFRA